MRLKTEVEGRLQHGKVLTQCVILFLLWAIEKSAKSLRQARGKSIYFGKTSAGRLAHGVDVT